MDVRIEIAKIVVDVIKWLGDKMGGRIGDKIAKWAEERKDRGEKKEPTQPDTTENHEEKDEAEQAGYYFVCTDKKVYISSNGDGVLICTSDLYVNEPTEVKSFLRTLDIEDAKATTELPKLKKMCSNKNKKPFDNYIFWYQSEDDIITGVAEDYEDIPLPQQSSKRFIQVKFLVDHGKLQKGRQYRIIYGYSIPGLYPIKNGVIDFENVPYDKTKYTFSSSIAVKHLAKKLRFSIYFERGIKIAKTPMAHLLVPKKPTDSGRNGDESRCCEYENDIIYQKYSIEVDRPESFEKVFLEWAIKKK